MNKIKKIQLLKHPYIIGAGAAIILIAGVSYAYYKSNSVLPAYKISQVERGAITQEVDVSGQVNPAQSADLGFVIGGKIALVNVQIGQSVSAGQTLVELSNSDLVAQLNQAQADVDGQTAKLKEMENGPRPEQVALSTTQLQKAQQDLNNIYSGVYDTIQDAYSKADDAVRKQTDDLFTNPETQLPALNFQPADNQLKINSESQRAAVNSELASWNSELETMSSNSSDSDLENEIENSQNHLAAIRDFLDILVNALSSAVPTPSFPQSSIDSYKNNLSIARTEVNGAISELNAESQTIKSQKLVVQTYQDQLNVTKAGYTQEEIDAQQAQVDHYLATLKNVQAQIAKGIITAPFSGIVSAVNAKLGEIASPNVSAISLISGKQFEIDTYVSEADIAKIKTGNDANVTLDAYGSSPVFPAKVVTIDPAQTVVNGAPSYKVVLQFNNDDSRVKAGMTANVSIITVTDQSVLILPREAVMRKNDEMIVLIPGSGGQPIQKIVTTGIESADGKIEILRGLSEGDKVINFGE